MLSGDVEYWHVGQDMWVDVKDDQNLYCVTAQGDQRRYDFDVIRLDQIKALGVLVGIRVLERIVVLTDGHEPARHRLQEVLRGNVTLLEPYDLNAPLELPLRVRVLSLYEGHAATLAPYFSPEVSYRGGIRYNHLVLDDDLYTLLKLKL